MPSPEQFAGKGIGRPPGCWRGQGFFIVAMDFPDAQFLFPKAAIDPQRCHRLIFRIGRRVFPLVHIGAVHTQYAADSDKCKESAYAVAIFEVENITGKQGE